jgi:hypothetical protein
VDDRSGLVVGSVMTDLNANGMYDQPARSLTQYAEELRDKLDLIERGLKQYPIGLRPSDMIAEYQHVSDRLLAVERQLNWRAGI